MISWWKKRNNFIFAGFRSHTTVCLYDTIMCDCLITRMAKTRDRTTNRVEACNFSKKFSSLTRLCLSPAWPCVCITLDQHYQHNHARWPCLVNIPKSNAQPCQILKHNRASRFWFSQGQGETLSLNKFSIWKYHW